MFKLVVFFTVVAAAVAAPGYLHSAVALPVATSHSSRIDIHSKPIVTYVAPAVVAAPIVKTIVAAPALYPSAVSHSSRYDVHSAPIVTSVHGYGGYGLGAYGHGGYGGYGGYGHGGYGHGGYVSGHYW